MSAHTGLSHWFYALAFGAAFVAFGCDDPLREESLIQETRVLGARVEVEGDAGRASPAARETAHFSAFLAAPDGAPSAGYALSVCGVQPTNSGFPSCATPAFGSVLQPDSRLGNPNFDFTVPADLDTSKTPHGFVRGLICPNDTAAVDANGDPSCAAGPGETIAFEFDFAGPGEDNQNPSFAADSLTLDGNPWPVPDESAGCEALPQVALGTKHSFGVALRDSDFDSLVQTTAEDPTRETILLSQFSTAGKLAHLFVSLTPQTPTSSTDWDAPSQADAANPITHFYFVIRDSRGGEDLAERALCIAP